MSVTNAAIFIHKFNIQIRECGSYNCQRTVIILPVNQHILENVVNNGIIIVDDFSTCYTQLCGFDFLYYYSDIYIFISIIGTFGHV